MNKNNTDINSESGYFITSDKIIDNKLAYFDDLKSAKEFAKKLYIHEASTGKIVDIPRQHTFTVVAEDGILISAFKDLTTAINYADQFTGKNNVDTVVKDKDEIIIIRFMSLKDKEKFNIGDECFRLKDGLIIQNKVIGLIKQENRETSFILDDGYTYCNCNELFTSVDNLLERLKYKHYNYYENA